MTTMRNGLPPPFLGCVRCKDERPDITVDLPEGDVCAPCVQKLVKQLRAKIARLERQLDPGYPTGKKTEWRSK